MNDELVRICIGYDDREAVAYHVLSHSLLSRSSLPLAITPIALPNVKNMFNREANSLQSTQFSFSRFLTPALSNFEGWSVFMDCDILCLADIAELWALRDDKYAVMCVKHDHKPKDDTKFLGAVQTQYEKKNWSSVMMLNNAKCKALTPDYVNSATGLELHRFKWLESDDLIGEIPQGWNHLADYSDTAPEDVRMIHYTEGGPYFKGYENCEYAKEWFQERDGMQTVIT